MPDAAPQAAKPPTAAVRQRTDTDSGALWQRDAADLAAKIRAGAVSSREVVLACLGRMDEVNGRINAVVRRFDEEALAAADAADAARKAGKALGPLHGVPVTIKINIDQRGHPTDGGVVANANLIAEIDNPVVANLRDAGAVIIGRTNAPCLSMRWQTDNELHGATLNPWHAGITPGGSSGGAAAAVAAGIGPIAHGNDIAGSIRYPAYCCGLFGLKPTFGRVPTGNATAPGPVPISSQLMAVQGPLTRSLRDVRLAFEAMAKPSPRDPRSVVPAPFAPLPRPIRVALVASPKGAVVHPAVSDAVRHAGRCLEAAGCVVEEIEPPRHAAVADLWARMAMADVLAALQPLIDEKGDVGIRRAIALWREVLPHYTAADALAALGDRAVALRDWQLFLESYPIILMPVCYDLPFPVGFDVKDATETRRVIAAQSPLLSISVLGLPSLSVPTGLVDGVPTGVQVVAGRYREDLLFEIGDIIEQHGRPSTPIDPRGAA